MEKLSKQKLKAVRRVIQDNICERTKEKLSSENKLTDLHRKTPRILGGKYNLGNVELMTAEGHLIQHGNLVERDPKYQSLKNSIDTKRYYTKLRVATFNKIDAYKRGDYENPLIVEAFNIDLQRYAELEKEANKIILKKMKEIDHPLIKASEGVRGLGPYFLAVLLVYINIYKAENVGKLWRYLGYDVASHERYSKGDIKRNPEKGWGGNQKLRTDMFNLACSFIKQGNKNFYTPIYYQTKERLSNSTAHTYSRMTGKSSVHRMMWKDTKPSHRHMAAIRKMMKHFLADMWFVWRELEGLPTRPMWIHTEKGGHTTIIKATDRGWKI